MKSSKLGRRREREKGIMGRVSTGENNSAMAGGSSGGWGKAEGSGKR